MSRSWCPSWGWKTWDCSRLAYFADFLAIVANSSAAQCRSRGINNIQSRQCVCDRDIQVNGLPTFIGIRINSSGRFPSMLVSPLGSFAAGIPANASRSFNACCMLIRPSAVLHAKQWRPLVPIIDRHEGAEIQTETKPAPATGSVWCIVQQPKTAQSEEYDEQPVWTIAVCKEGLLCTICR